MIAKIIDSARVGIGLDLNMIFDNVASFEVLGWGDIRVMISTMVIAALFKENF